MCIRDSSRIVPILEVAAAADLEPRCEPLENPEDIVGGKTGFLACHLQFGRSQDHVGQHAVGDELEPGGASERTDMANGAEQAQDLRRSLDVVCACLLY